MAIDLYGTLGNLEFNEGLSETTPPFLANQLPAPSGTNVPITASFYLTVDDAEAGVLLSTVVIQVNSGSGFVTAWSGSMFQANFTGSILQNGIGWDFLVNPIIDLPYSQEVDVRVQADDADGNSLDQTYFFTTQASPPVVFDLPFHLKKLYPFDHRHEVLVSLPSETIDRQRHTRIYPMVRRRLRKT